MLLLVMLQIVSAYFLCGFIGHFCSGKFCSAAAGVILIPNFVRMAKNHHHVSEASHRTNLLEGHVNLQLIFSTTKTYQVLVLVELRK